MLIDHWIRKCLNKKSYRTLQEAQRVAHDQMRRRNAEKLNLRAYHCKQCAKYHLTSRGS